MYQLTIYTPTYNRAHLLPSLYESLCHQTCKNFIWLIVDDGSTDNTAALAQLWKTEEKISVQYLYKENGGVHTARDLAYSFVETELIVAIDSDDTAVNTFVEDILVYWNKYGGNKYAGIFARAKSPSGIEIGKKYPDIHAATYQDLTFKYKIPDDKATVLRTDIIKKIPNSPVFAGEKLLGEGYKWINLPDIPFLLLNKSIYIHNYVDDGYTINARRHFFLNLNGKRATYRQYMTKAHYIRPKIKGCIGYIITSLLLKDKYFIKNSPRPFTIILLLPLGIVGYFYILAKWGKYRKNSYY